MFNLLWELLNREVSTIFRTKTVWKRSAGGKIRVQPFAAETTTMSTKKLATLSKDVIE